MPGILLLGSCLVLAALTCGCGGYDTSTAKKPSEPVEKPTPPTPPQPPAPKAIGLAKLRPITLDPGGRDAVELQVERNGNEGSILAQFEDVPEGISVTSAEIPAGQSAGKLEVAAAEKLGDEELKATLHVTVKLGDLQAKQPLPLTVKKLNLPSFRPAAAVTLQPGATTVVDLAIERKGYRGPLELRVEGLPKGVTGKVGNIAAEQSATTLELAAAADAPDAQQTIRVAVTLYGRTIDVQIPLRIDRLPYRVKSFMVVTLKPGETKPVQMSVERRTYKGPLHLDVVDLPEGVTAPKVELTPQQTSATLEFSAAEDARERVRSAKVISTGGNLTRTDPLVVRVSHGESGFLPREIGADPQVAPLLRRGSFGGRLTAQSKQALVDAYGGTQPSEEAVLRGLRWLAQHQRSDGCWSLINYSQDVPKCDCQTEFEKEVVDSDTAGTAFGVLPFLGAGITHNRAPEKPPELAQYRDNVYRGIAFLAKNQVMSKDPLKAGNLGGNLYAHALGTMALCEAYGLSGDERLKVPAQLAVKYLAESQHSAGGGWRYSPRQEGDMSATGWVFLAIRSGQLAGLPIGRGPLVRAERFVDSCAAGPEDAKLSRYSYQPHGPEKLSVSAAGLLTRQYLGCSKDDPDLQAGCRYLMEHLPPESGGQLGQIYYYHYATQVLHHMEGSDFDLWNYRIREHLVRTQETQGHKAGSWNPQGTDWGNRGGRLYATSMALLTLEVYYRHLPMYRPVKRTED